MPLTSLDYMQQGHDSKHKQHGQLLVMVSSHLKHSHERRSGATSGSTRGVPGVGGLVCFFFRMIRLQATSAMIRSPYQDLISRVPRTINRHTTTTYKSCSKQGEKSVLLLLMYPMPRAFMSFNGVHRPRVCRS